jgi:hypothetical protein
VANTVFSLCAATGSAIVAVAAATKGLWVVTGIWSLLALGFLVRASERRRGDRD